MLASPRGFSQLAASFFAFLRLGIHTHALSSLTIKFTLDTECLRTSLCVLPVYIQLSKIAPPSRGALVGLGRVELPTSPLSGVRSSHLSYRPISGPWWS